MPQYTFDDGFYHASRARDISVGNGSGNTNVLNEINALQVAVNEQALAGEMGVSVGETGGEYGSVMTVQDDYDGPGTSSHFDAWSNIYQASQLKPENSSVLRRASIEMDRVIAYFTRLGYSIQRVRGGTIGDDVGTDDRIQWLIKW